MLSVLVALRDMQSCNEFYRAAQGDGISYQPVGYGIEVFFR